MTRLASRLVIAVLVLQGTALRAQTADAILYSKLIRQLPASTFEAQQKGVRGMELASSQKLDPVLRDLVDGIRSGSGTGTRGLELGATSADSRIPLAAHASDARRAAALAQEILNLGGAVTARYDTTVLALLGGAAIDRLAASANLFYLAVQNRLDPTQTAGATVAGASVRATRVQALHAAGVRGRGVKIGIIDSGFGGYGRLQKLARVPVPKARRSFPASRAFENDTVHGTACAEIVHEMAPDAELFLAAIDPGEGATIEAARWLIAQGVDIISFSMGTPKEPGDGSGTISRFVDSTTAETGVLWIVSSGNAGDLHWSGPNRDTDGDGIIETGPNGESVLIIVPQEDDLKVLVRWNDWGPNPRAPTSSQNINAYLLRVRETPGGMEIDKSPVARGIDEQSGGPGRPIEEFRYQKAGIKGQPLLLVLKNANTTRPLDVHVFIDKSTPATLTPRTAAGSVVAPAMSRYAVAVGAWDVETSELAPYSSQGPTEDHRLKPEVAAPAGLPSGAYARKFHGTSASSPHVAGFAGLLKQVQPELRGLSLRAAVLRAVEPKGSPVPNMAFGHGWIDGGRVSVRSGTPAAGGPSDPDRTSIAHPSVATVALPMAWGGSVTADFLDRLRAGPAESAEFLVRVTTGRDLYRVGDGLKLGFKTSESCEYLLFHRSSQGAYTLMSPRGGAAGLLTAGTAYVLPSDDETFEVTPPVGLEELLLLCARRAIDMRQAARSGRVPAGLVTARHPYEVSR